MSGIRFLSSTARSVGACLAGLTILLALAAVHARAQLGLNFCVATRTLPGNGPTQNSSEFSMTQCDAFPGLSAEWRIVGRFATLAEAMALRSGRYLYLVFGFA
jgi:hypothetical protein